MQKQAQTAARKATASKNEGRAFCLLMAFFLIFEVFLTAVVLTRSFSAKPSKPQPPIDTEDTTYTTDTGDEPTVLPVFSGGVIPSTPKETAETKEITTLYSQYALLVDAESGEIVAGKGADVTFSPASMAKIMTLIVICENLSLEDLDQRITLTQDVTEYVMTGIYENADTSLIKIDKTTGQNLYTGDQFIIRDLIYGIGVASAADCTLMLVSKICPAASLAESEQAFVELMNQKAEDMGLPNTHFDNAVGLESASTKTTAIEMATIMSYAMQSELIVDVLSVKEKNILSYYMDNGVEKTVTFYLKSTLFHSRMNSYKSHYNIDFNLQTANLIAGKTGRLTEDDNPKMTKISNLACLLKGKISTKTYILIVADCSQLYETMKDVKTIADTYIQ